MIFSRFERTVAFRYLRPRGHGFVSVIAGFSLLGIALGVATLIIVMSVMNGFRAELLGRVLGVNGHLTVMAMEGGPIPDYEALAEKLLSRGFDIVSGGTDTHLMLVDLRPKGVKGNAAEQTLERANITCNKNGIPFDPEKPTITSGIRLGTPAGTTRGFGIREFQKIGDLIGDVLEGLAANPDDNSAAEAAARAQVVELCKAYPIYNS